MKGDSKSRLCGFFDLLFRINRRNEKQMTEEERRLRMARENLRKAGMLSSSTKQLIEDAEREESEQQANIWP